MSSWPATKARRVFAALQRVGWCHDRTVGSHKIMRKDGWPDYPFHDSEELGPPSLRKSQKRPAFDPRICEAYASLSRSRFSDITPANGQFLHLTLDQPETVRRLRRVW